LGTAVTGRERLERVSLSFLFRHKAPSYGVLDAGEYVEEHWLFAAGMATIGGAGACVGT